MSNYTRFKFYALIARIRLGVYSSDTVDLSGYGLTAGDVELLIYSIKLSPKMKTQIKVIDLSNNNIRRLVIAELPGLRILTIVGSKLEELYLYKLPNLRELDASLNRIIARIDIRSVVGLTKLNLMGNQIESLPINFYHNLEDLNIAGNRLMLVDLSTSYKLRVANFAYNRIKTVLSSTNTNAELKIIISESRLDATTKTFLANLQNRDADLVHTVNRRMQATTLGQIDLLSTASITAYFAVATDVYKKHHTADLLLECARIQAALTAKFSLPSEIAVGIAVDSLLSNFQGYIKAIMNTLLKTCNPESAGMKILQSFATDDVPQIIRAMHDSAQKVITNNKATRSVILRRSIQKFEATQNTQTVTNATQPFTWLLNQARTVSNVAFAPQHPKVVSTPGLSKP